MIDIEKKSCDRQDVDRWRKEGLKVNLVDLREFYEDPLFKEADLQISSGSS